jgi:iron complex transport system ATP-binding protein
MKNNILEVKSLSCGYTNKPVISDVSFILKKSEITGFIGPNGSGKTTLFRTLTKIIKPSSGQILYQGIDISQYSQMELAKHIALMPQFLDIAFPFSVKEFVAMSRFAHKQSKQIDEKIIDECLSLAQIEKIQDRKINQLSGGEKQMVFLAQALAQTPNLLLLDEPTSHLDIGHQTAICDLIKKLNKEKQLTILMVVHDLNLASEYCDNLILFNNGKIHACGTPADVLTYQNIEQVYKTIVIVQNNPLSDKPHIFPISKTTIKQHE